MAFFFARTVYIGRDRRRRVAGPSRLGDIPGPGPVRECKASSPAWRRRFLLLHGCAGRQPSRQGLPPALRTKTHPAKLVTHVHEAAGSPFLELYYGRGRLHASLIAVAGYRVLAPPARAAAEMVDRSEMAKVSRNNGCSVHKHLVTCRATSGGELPKSTALGDELRFIL